MIKDGAKVQACVACADMYGVAEKLQELGMVLKGMGVPLNEMLKQELESIDILRSNQFTKI